MKDLSEQRFGRLIVVRRVGSDKFQKALWECKCDCGNKSIVTTSLLKRGITESCGCLQRERTSQANKKYNKYDLSGDYGIGYTFDNEEFYFDLEDYENIRDYCWYIDSSSGYVVSGDKNNRSKNIIFHRLVMNCFDDKMVVDHIKHKNYDNRKSQLRICTQSQNNMNHAIRKDNTSGITGVCFDKRTNKWYSQIKVKGKKRITLGYFDDFNNAVMARKRAEEKYFGEYSYDNSMKQ